MLAPAAGPSVTRRFRKRHAPTIIQMISTQTMTMK
jgi:hypothetical protein